VKKQKTNLGFQRVVPGQLIQTETGYLRGHGTHEIDNKLYASVSGIIERVNKLISVKPLRARYSGEVGDIIVGRISEVAQQRWKVDVNGRQLGSLELSAINLPGGVQRRRTTTDELQMRSFFVENDLISAEVQQIKSEGLLVLHTRSMKYGKLARGQLVQIPCTLIKRVKNHFFTFGFGVDVILGLNGNIWISETPKEGSENQETTTANTEPIPVETRKKMARLANSIRALSHLFIAVYPDTILDTYNSSIEKQIPVKDMLRPDIIKEITQKAVFRGS